MVVLSPKEALIQEPGGGGEPRKDRGTRLYLKFPHALSFPTAGEINYSVEIPVYF